MRRESCTDEINGLPKAVPDNISSSMEPSSAMIGTWGVLGTLSVAPVKRLKKPDLAGLDEGAGELEPDVSERMLAARELADEAAGVA